MRKTKIICTLGPSTDDPKILEAMMDSGMDVARFNFSHGTHAEHKVRLELLKKLRKENNLPVAALLDTKGPEIRLKTFAEGKVTLEVAERMLSPGYGNLIDQRRPWAVGPLSPVPVCEGGALYCGALAPIIAGGDLAGSVGLVGPATQDIPSECTQALLRLAAAYLGRQLEE